MAVSARAAYRRLLKAVRIHIGSEPHFKEFVREEFRKNAGLSHPEAAAKLQLAKDYTSLITGVHHHSELLQSYNIAVDRTEEEKHRLQDTAHRVGLQLPQVYKDDPLTLNNSTLKTKEATG